MTMWLIRSIAARRAFTAVALVGLILVLGCSEPATEGSESESGASNQSAESSRRYYCGPAEEELNVLRSTMNDGSFLEWNLDGTELIFDHESDIYAVDIGGRYLRSIVDANPRHLFGWGFHADLSPDGSRIVYSSCEFRDEFDGYEIATVNIDGTNRRRLTSDRIRYDHYPVWSPDGDRIAFLSVRGPEYDVPFANLPKRYKLFTMDADGSDLRQVTPDSLKGILWVGPRWSPDGEHLLFVESDDDVFNPGVGRLERKVNANTFFVIRADGSDLQPLGKTVVLPVWSPDGSRIAYVDYGDAEDELDIFTVSPDGSDVRKLTIRTRGAYVDDPRRSLRLEWSPDGSEIAFVRHNYRRSSGENDAFGIFSVAVDGSGNERLIADFENHDKGLVRLAWSPDGSKLGVARAVYGERGFRKGFEYFSVARDGSDVRLLARGGSVNIAAMNSGWQGVTGVEACTAGWVVQDPHENPGLVKDCEALMRASEELGESFSNWSAEHSIADWIVLYVTGLPARVRGIGAGNTLAQFDGPIPSQFGSLSALFFLNISDLGITGIIPPELGKLASLDALNISDNPGLEGHIPPELGALANLETLDLSENSLTGTIPPELGKFTNLITLYLQNNSLEGKIPRELGNVGSNRGEWGTSIDLRGNSLTGCIPRELKKDRIRIWTDGLRFCQPTLWDSIRGWFRRN